MKSIICTQKKYSLINPSVFKVLLTELLILFFIACPFAPTTQTKIILSSSSSVIGTGGEQTTITATIVDNNGNIVTSADNIVTFSLTGPGTLYGTNSTNATNGKATIDLKSKSTPGTIVVTAKADGLSGDSVEILVEDEDVPEGDLRRYQHGIDFVQISPGNYHLIWSSSGNPPSGKWTHDIFYSFININNLPGFPQNNAVKIISRGEAQEPASSDISADGHIMITLEDGYDASNWVAQRFGVYGKQFVNNPRPYDDKNTTIYDGGHSGHVAAAENIFVVFWSDDWNDNVPGADGIGVGCHVIVDTFTSTGVHMNKKNVAVSNNSYDWWPVIAATNKRACLLWQRYVDGDQYSRLMYAIYNPVNNTFVKSITKLQDYTRYYTYDVQYYPVIDRFLVYGTFYNGGGYAFLIDTNGTVVDSLTSLPAGIREAQPSIKSYDDSALAVYPKAPNGLLALKLTSQKISVHEQIAHSYKWQHMGIDGIFIDEDTIYIAALSHNGMRTFQIDVKP